MMKRVIFALLILGGLGGSALAVSGLTATSAAANCPAHTT